MKTIPSYDTSSRRQYFYAGADWRRSWEGEYKLRHGVSFEGYCRASAHLISDSASLIFNILFKSNIVSFPPQQSITHEQGAGRLREPSHRMVLTVRIFQDGFSFFTRFITQDAGSVPSYTEIARYSLLRPTTRHDTCHAAMIDGLFNASASTDADRQASPRCREY